MFLSWFVLAVPQKGSVFQEEAVGGWQGQLAARRLAGWVLRLRPRWGSCGAPWHLCLGGVRVPALKEVKPHQQSGECSVSVCW